MVTLVEARPRAGLVVMGESHETPYVQRLRRMKGDKSLRTFADELGVSPNTISGHLEGDDPRVPTLITIADRIGMRRIDLVLEAYPVLAAAAPPSVRDEFAAMLETMDEETIRSSIAAFGWAQDFFQRALRRSPPE